jgi:hypothetical protein
LARLQIDVSSRQFAVYENITVEDVDRDIADLKSVGVLGVGHR